MQTHELRPNPPTFEDSRMNLLSRLLALAVLSLVAAGAWAQAYPAKPIALIIPFPAGGSTDIVGRIVAEGLSRELGRPVVVDNRGGAGGAIGAQAIADAAADGYTLGLATVSTHVINPSIRGETLKYDPLRSFSHISQLASVPNVVSIHPGVPANNMVEFLDYLRKNPGKVNFATPGAGSLGHMMGETFQYNGKVSMLHVPYRGAGPAVNDTMAGHVQVFFDNLPSSLPYIQSGKLRALAVASDKRVSSLPDIPTFAEAGLPLVNDPAWFGLVGPANLSPEVIARLNAAVVKVLHQPDVVKRLENISATPVGSSPDAFRKLIGDSVDNTRKVISAAKLTFE
jgi:tripartite-type tricarboxylate transporter receptor subunit TctC